MVSICLKKRVVLLMEYRGSLSLLTQVHFIYRNYFTISDVNFPILIIPEHHQASKLWLTLLETDVHPEFLFSRTIRSYNIPLIISSILTNIYLPNCGPTFYLYLLQRGLHFTSILPAGDFSIYSKIVQVQTEKAITVVFISVPCYKK